MPISEDALSDCSRRRRISGVSGGSAKVGELRELDMSVGGVEVPDSWDSEHSVLDVEVGSEDGTSCKLGRCTGPGSDGG